jgi:antitoxin HicB
MLQYCALLEPDRDSGGFVVTFPDFSWGVSQGESEEEAMEMAADALAMILKDHIERGVELPRPGRARSRKHRPIRLPALRSAKVELYREFIDSGLRKAELAGRLGISKTNVDRLFDLDHRSRLEQIEAAFRALGKELTIDVRSAA